MRAPDPDEVWETNRDEWQLLHDAATAWEDGPQRVRDALSALAEHYQQRGAWDEHSAVRAAILGIPRLRRGSSGPAPGGPFPRIGAPREGERPVTLLGRWLDRSNLPELFETPEITPRQLAASLRVELARAPSRELYIRIGDALCVQLQFVAAEAEYERSKAAARKDDVRRVLAGPVPIAR